MKTQLIASKSYTKLDESLFNHAWGNRGDNKPVTGGLWTSSVCENGKSSWMNFALNEGFYDEDEVLNIVEIEVAEDANVLFIDSKEDYMNALENFGLPVDKQKHPLAPYSVSAEHDKILDFKSLSAHYDALSVTLNGRRENYNSFYFWDCESTVWFNMDKLKQVN